MTTGESLTGSDRVRKLQTMLHAKAKEEPDRRLYEPHPTNSKNNWRGVLSTEVAAWELWKTFSRFGSPGLSTWFDADSPFKERMRSGVEAPLLRDGAGRGWRCARGA